MGNIIGEFREGIKYDLKGSFQNRTQLKKGESPNQVKANKVALKDNDWREHVKSITFKERPRPSQEVNGIESEVSVQDNASGVDLNLIGILERDARFLGQ